MDTAMIFAAGRGERMRPLTDRLPKPLLEVGGKPLIVWQIEALKRAGITRIVINHAWLGATLPAALGDGSRWGVALLYSDEGNDALETAGGIARALPLLLGDARPGKRFIAVAGDIFCDIDYAVLQRRATDPAPMHLVMVPNPPFHPNGDFVLDESSGKLLPDSSSDRPSQSPPTRLTFGSIGIYDTALFTGLAAQTPTPKMALGPMMRTAIAAAQASGERFDGVWHNVGTPAQLAELDAQLRKA